MLNKLSSVILFLVGLINIAPIVVFFNPTMTMSLYGIKIEGGSLTILMRHRAALLSIVGFALIFAAFRRRATIPAITIALFSKFTFIFLVMTSPFTAEIRQVATIDLGAIFLLLVAFGIHIYKPPETNSV